MLVTVLALLEVGARWLDPRLPVWTGKDHEAVVMTGHPVRLWGLGEGIRKNATTTATISSLGIRAPVPSVPRPAGRERILVLGDSSFFGYGVDDHATLSAHIRRLESSRIDSVNASVPGYSILQARLLMDEVGWATQPSLLLIGCFWSDTKLAPYTDRDLLNSRSAGRMALLRGSALVRLIAGRLRVGGIVSWTRFDELPGTAERRVPVRDYASALDGLVREAARRGIGAALITPPEAVVLFGEAEPPHQWEPYLQAQVAVAAHHEIPHIQTTTAFRAHVEQAVASSSRPAAQARRTARSQLFIDDMHPSALGQVLMAQATMTALQAASWPEVRLLGEGQGEMDVEGLEDLDLQQQEDASRPVPMANLFPHGSVPPPQGKVAAKAQAEPGSDGAWEVYGDARVARGGDTCKVKVVAESGRTIASATLLKTGTYRFQMPATVERVDVTLRGTLCAGKGQATQESGGRVTLSPRDR